MFRSTHNQLMLTLKKARYVDVCTSSPMTDERDVTHEFATISNASYAVSQDERPLICIKGEFNNVTYNAEFSDIEKCRQFLLDNKLLSTDGYSASRYVLRAAQSLQWHNTILFGKIGFFGGVAVSAMHATWATLYYCFSNDPYAYSHIYDLPTNIVQILAVSCGSGISTGLLFDSVGNGYSIISSTCQKLYATGKDIVEERSQANRRLF